MRVDTRPIMRTFCVQHAKQLLSIHKYVQTLGLVNVYHRLDIDLLAEAAVKHYFCKTDHNLTVEEFDLRNT